MVNRFFYEKPRRLDKLTKADYEDLSFDLINAFALVKNPKDSAQLLHDLLTRKEIQNLAKRLRIAKLLLSGTLQEEIVEILHCSFATITKVKIWLDEGGEGLRNVILKLPKRTSQPRYKSSYIKPDLPRILLTAAQEVGFASEKKRLDKFLESLESKHLINKQISQAVNDEFRTLYHQRKKKEFIKSTSQR